MQYHSLIASIAAFAALRTASSLSVFNIVRIGKAALASEPSLPISPMICPGAMPTALRGHVSSGMAHICPNHAHAKPWTYHPIHGLELGRKESRDATHWQNHAHAKPWAWHPIHGLEWAWRVEMPAWVKPCPRKAMGMAPDQHGSNHAHAKPWAWHPTYPLEFLVIIGRNILFW